MNWKLYTLFVVAILLIIYQRGQTSGRGISKLLPYIVSPEGVYRHESVISLGRAVSPKEGLPKYFKYKESALVPIRNQGKCASCWSYAVCDLLADRLSLATGGKIKRHLSVQELLACFRPLQFSCATGGIPELAYGYVAQHGLSTEVAYPYVQANGGVMRPCDRTLSGNLSWMEYLYNNPLRYREYPEKVFVRPESIRNLCVSPRWSGSIQDNILNMKSEIFLHGPICGTLLVYDDLYNYDGSSVYHVKEGARIRGGHAIEIFGWCDPGQNTMEKGFEEGYWICRNSWGGIWPRKLPKHSGWFYVRMGTNEAQIESRASSASPIVPDGIEKQPLLASAYVSYNEYVNDPERVNFFADLAARRSGK